MEQIKKESLDLELADNYDYSFDILEDGLYLIEIIASAKSWWQKFKELRNFFNDDDLTVKIDATEFPKLNGRNGLFDGEVAWNGNNLKGLNKINVFVINLTKGNHILHFLVDQTPILKSISINKINEAEINYTPQKYNLAEDGDRRQWIAITLVDLPLKNLNIKASANYFPNEKDGDDMKLIIDGEIQKNENRKDFKNWYWCGMELKGQEKEFSRELNLEKKLHYIELWADREPLINSLTIGLGNPVVPEPEENKKSSEYIIRQITALYNELGQNIEFDKIPKPLENFNTYDKEIELASKEFDVEPAILKATIAQESSFGKTIDHDERYIGESGFMGVEKMTAIKTLQGLGYDFDYSQIPDVIRASAAYYNWVREREPKITFDNKNNPLKLYTQYREKLYCEAKDTKATGIKEFLYYYFYYKK